jgi:hypothetical protein
VYSSTASWWTYCPTWIDQIRKPIEGKEGGPGRGGRRALGRAGVVRKKALAGGFWRCVGGAFLPFFFLPVKASSIQSGNRRWELGTVWCTIESGDGRSRWTRTTTVRVREGQRRIWFRVRRCVSLLNRNRRLSSELLGRTHSRSLSVSEPFFFF